MSALKIGVDIGTTSTKAMVVFTLDGTPVAHHAVDYPCRGRPRAGPGADPPRGAGDDSLRDCPQPTDEVVCVSFSAAMPSVTTSIPKGSR
jgi:sugar (pentulose or hexulose) kinase